MPSCNLLENLLRVMFLAPAIAICAIYIAKSVMTEPVRKYCDRIHPWTGYASKCAFCLIGWSSMVLTFLYRPLIFRYLFDILWNIGGWNIFSILNFLVSWGALWGLGTFWYIIIWPFLEKHAPKIKINWSRH
ncbi:MAG: hypothetical protein Q7R73_03035 [bacterium]|nr:hypothetical protein [bacterium]